MIIESNKECNDIFERVKKVVKDVLQVPEEAISMDSEFESDLGTNSIDQMTLILELEDEFNREISEDDVMALSTIGEVVKYIAKLI